MDLKGNIQSRIAARSNEDLTVDIPEWGSPDGEDCTIHYNPITAGEIDRVARLHKGFPETWTFESMIDLIVFKAKDVDGTKVFDKGDKPMLRRESAKVISTLAGAFMASRGIEDALGNLEEADLEEN